MSMFYEDIWGIIYQHTTIINFDIKQTFHCYPNKISYEAYKNELKRRESDFLCMVCGGNDLIYHCCYDEDEENEYDEDEENEYDEDEENEYDDHNPECENELDEHSGIYCYASSADGENLKNLRWNICKSCKSYHNICTCNTYRNLYSHPGQFFIGDPRKKIYKNEELYMKYSPDESFYTQECVVNNNIKYFSTKLAEFTGSDGGLAHEWICKNNLCIEYNKIKCYSDK